MNTTRTTRRPTTTETPLTRFWRELNARRQAVGRDEVTFGPAHKLFDRFAGDSTGVDRAFDHLIAEEDRERQEADDDHAFHMASAWSEE